MNIEEKINALKAIVLENNSKNIKVKITILLNNISRDFFYNLNANNIDLLDRGGAIWAFLALDESSSFEIVDYSFVQENRHLIVKSEQPLESEFIKMLRVIFFKNINSHEDNNFIDRSGLFKPASGIPFPSIIETNKSISQIIDERILLFKDTNPLLMWGGGIDSNAVLACFLKHNINFSIAYNPTLFNEYSTNLKNILPNNIELLNTTILSKENLKEIYNTRVIITGDCADQLFPGMQHSLDPDKESFKFLDIKTNGIDSYFTEPLPDNIKYMSAREWFSKKFANDYMVELVRGEEFYDSYLAPKIINAPINIQYGYQLKWFLKFIFKYQKNATKRFATNFNAFFNTDDFQRWAFTNLETNYNTGCASYLTYKQPLKDYAYSVLNDENILNQYKTHL